MDLVLIPSINWTIICLHNNIKLYVLKGFGVTHFRIGYEYCYTPYVNIYLLMYVFN
jgi:hypothetical protein